MSSPLEASARISRLQRGGATEDTTCRCSVCRRAFESVEEFDRHRYRGRCRNPDMSTQTTKTKKHRVQKLSQEEEFLRPSFDQFARDRNEDLGLVTVTESGSATGQYDAFNDDVAMPS